MDLTVDMIRRRLSILVVKTLNLATMSALRSATIVTSMDCHSCIGANMVHRSMSVIPLQVSMSHALC